MPRPPRIEGCAIVSEDGMLAGADGVQPPSLIVPGDQAFFTASLDAADAVVHGRNSREHQGHPERRHRLIVTRTVPAIARIGDTPRVLRWNPAGASFDQAWTALGLEGGTLLVIGGTDVFGLFLSRYEAFHLTRVPGVRLPGGRPVFPGVPERSPEDLMREHGLKAGASRALDGQSGVTLVTWEPDRVARQK